MARNPAFGYWTEEETNWSDKDTAFIEKTINKNQKAIPTSFEEILAEHEKN